MAAKKKYKIDYQKCYEMEQSGITIKQIAKEAKVPVYQFRNLYSEWKNANIVREVKDIGKAHALHNAGWSNEKIADEFRSTVDEVLKALAQEPPKIEEENNDAEFYGELDF